MEKLAKLEVISSEKKVSRVLKENCNKVDEFQLLYSKEDEWKTRGCPKSCSYCWNLKCDGESFYC